MLWNWDTIDACFLAESWQVRSRGGFAGLCIGVVLLVVYLEFVRRAARQYDRYILAQYRQETAVRAIQGPNPSPPDASESPDAKTPRSTQAAAAALEKEVSFRPSVSQQGTRALLHTAQFAIAYWIMLLGMYYNGYVIMCIFIGAFVGSFIFQWERLDSRCGDVATTTDARRITGCCE